MWYEVRTGPYCITACGMPYWDGTGFAAMVAAMDCLPIAINDTGINLIASKWQISRNSLRSDLPMGYMKMTAKIVPQWNHTQPWSLLSQGCIWALCYFNVIGSRPPGSNGGLFLIVLCQW